MKVRNTFDTTPPSPDLVLPGFPAGSVGLLTGEAGSGKTLFALELCCAVAGGASEGGNLLGLPVMTGGRVSYINGEDTEAELHRLLHGIASRIEESLHKSIIRNFSVEAGFGAARDISSDEHRDSLIESCRNSRLIVFDTLRRLHPFDESKRHEAARLLNGLDQIACETGAAVLCLDRPDPESRLGERVRWKASLRVMKEEESRSVSEDLGSGQSLSQTRGKIEPHRYFSELWIHDRFYPDLGTVNWFKLTDDGVLVPARLYSIEER